MDKLIGTWVCVHDKTENVDAYADAMELGDDMRAFLKDDTDFRLIFSQKNGKITVQTLMGGREVETSIFELGEPFTVDEMGMKTRNVYKLEGDSLVGVHNVEGGMTTTTKKYIKDDMLIIEATCKGVVMKNYFKRA